MGMRALAGVAIATLAAVVPAAAAAAPGLPSREADPIVLEGADVPRLIGATPGTVVAFAHDGDWEQIPVQVDERAVIDYGVVRNLSPGAFSHLAYTDPGTLAGSDPNPAVDADDEIALMARDLGDRAADAPSPAGVVPSTRTAVAVADPLQRGANRWLYLFRTNAGLDPSAGRSYVDYEFSLDSGPYPGTYAFGGVDRVTLDAPPANPENSSVRTEAYSAHLLSRWVTDELRLRNRGALGPDILDGDKAQVSRGCGRSELSFSRGGGGFIANISGPVRAIRSQIGANSGTFTQRDDVFYAERQDTSTYLRVHAGIAQVSQYLDFSPAATGMTYRASHTGQGPKLVAARIDGVPDPSVPGEGANGLQPPAAWQQVSGAAGSLTIVNRVDTNLPGFQQGSFYRDQGGSPDFEQCGGYADGQSIGSSGAEFKSNGDNTDPTRGAAYRLTGERTIYFGPPNAGAGIASLRSEQAGQPLRPAVHAEGEPDPARLRLTADTRTGAVKPGRRVRVLAAIENAGEARTGAISLCAAGLERVTKVPGCKQISSVPGGQQRSKGLRVKVRKRAQRKQRVKVRVKATSGSETLRRTVRLRVKK